MQKRKYKKMYTSSVDEDKFENKELVEFNYPEKDFHSIYVGEIEKILVKE